MHYLFNDQLVPDKNTLLRTGGTPSSCWRQCLSICRSDAVAAGPRRQDRVLVISGYVPSTDRATCVQFPPIFALLRDPLAASCFSRDPEWRTVD